MTLSMVLAGLWGVICAAAGAWLTKLSSWYYNLRRPKWQPPDWAFGPAWTLIFTLASYAAYLGWEGASSPGDKTLVVLLFLLNGVINMLWSVLFFRSRRPDWALIEVAVLWLSILAMIVLLWPMSPTASLALVPYILWVSFAAFLNRAIVRLNAPLTTAHPVER